MDDPRESELNGLTPGQEAIVERIAYHVVQAREADLRRIIREELAAPLRDAKEEMARASEARVRQHVLECEIVQAMKGLKLLIAIVSGISVVGSTAAVVISLLGGGGR